MSGPSTYGWGVDWGVDFIETSVINVPADRVYSAGDVVYAANPLGVTVVDLMEPTLREVWAD